MKLKPLPANKVIKVLDKLGFKIVRKKGSHVILKHNDGRGLLRKIIKDANISKEEFMEMAEKL